jgi:tetratricopeptide (TPR) repeat protein
MIDRRMMIGIASLLGFVSAAQAAQPPASAPDTSLQPTTLPEELPPILSPEEQREAARKVIDAFVRHVTESPTFPPAAKAAVADGWAKHRADEDPQDFLLAGLSIVSEPFKTALAALEEQKYETAVPALRSLADAKDPYLSVNSRGLLARALVEQERLEEAEAILTPLAAEEKNLRARSFLEAEVDFLLGYCQLSNLKYDAALATLERFDRQHPDAPDKFRLPARQMLQELQARQPKGLGEVSDLMVYSARRLSIGEPGKPVEIRQEQAVDLLAKLIKEAEQREEQQRQSQQQRRSSAQGGGPPKGNRPPVAPADRSALPGGKSQIGRLDRSAIARPGEEWGRMRPEDRERILQSLRRSFPSQYRQLVEQYYKQLAKEQ